MKEENTIARIYLYSNDYGLNHDIIGNEKEYDGDLKCNHVKIFIDKVGKYKRNYDKIKQSIIDKHFKNSEYKITIYYSNVLKKYNRDNHLYKIEYWYDIHET